MATAVSPVGNSLGFGDQNLANQMQGETEEQRKKRLEALRSSQASRPGGIGAGYGAAVSPIGQSLGI